MKAIVYDKYGPPEVLQLKDVAKPVQTDNDILVRTYATSVTKYDCWQRSATAPTGFGLFSRLYSGPFKPKRMILGTELAGEVEAIGKNVKSFNVGDKVIGYTGMNLGAYSEYVCLNENSTVVKKPAKASYEEAGSWPCLSPAGVMEQEQEFLSLLADVESFQVDDVSLTITCSGGRQLYYVRASDK